MPKERFFIKVPLNTTLVRKYGPYPQYLNIRNDKGTAVHRRLSRLGLAGLEPLTQAAILTLVQLNSSRPIFYDVGSHIGSYSALVGTIFRRLGVAGYAFEASPRTADRTVAIRDANNLHYLVTRTAVSSEAGEITFYLSNKSDSSNSVNPEFRPGSPSITVPKTTIDDFVASGAPAPSVMKIDVETHEADVILGAKNVIKSARPWIICEFLTNADPGRLQEAIDFLAGENYNFYQLTESDGPVSVPAGEVVERRGGDRDWLLTPKPLGKRFGEVHKTWVDAIADCGQEKSRWARPEDIA